MENASEKRIHVTILWDMQRTVHIPTIR